MLWDTFGGCAGVQIPWEGAHSFRLRLAGVGSKPEQGAEEVGADVKDIRAGGSRPPDIW